MPWSKSKLPPAAKKLGDHQKEIFVAAANAALKDGKDEGAAVAIGLAAAKRSKQKVSKAFIEQLTDLLTKHFGGSEQEVEHVEVTKSVDDEQRRALFVVLEPDVVDLHGDTYSEVEVEKACRSFNNHCNVANLFHQVETESANIEQSFISPAEFTLDNGVTVKKGTWLQWWHFPTGDDVAESLWQGVKDGTFNGVSIGARATVEDI